MHRRDFLALATFGAAAANGAGMTGCRYARVDSSLAATIDRAVAAAVRFMVSKQLPDGSWRSETYGGLKDGPSLTAPISKTLFYIPNPSEEVLPSFRRGVDFLIQWVGEDGKIRAGNPPLSFPVYAAALASSVIGLEANRPGHLRAQSGWLEYLLKFRLGSNLGWDPNHPAFGGWGYASRVPEKPSGGKAPYEANISATLFGIAALRQAGIPTSNPIYQEILAFIKRCQNFAEAGEKGDERFDDGGLFFTPCDPPRNKAGASGTDRLGRERFNSYGSTTADGVRALLRCGLSSDSPRVRAARLWLEKHFTVADNPGTFAADREVLRNATYYYYVWSLAHAFTALGVGQVPTNEGSASWAATLAPELIAHQRDDGSWRNRFTDAKEDDPLIATPLAVAALAHCRWRLSGETAPPSLKSRSPGDSK